mgnify:CR=1 FL=1
MKDYLEASGYNAKKITPAALNVARENKLELLSLNGSGEGGRITLADVKDAVAELPKPMSTMRKVIARRLSESKHVMPHFYVTVSIDMSAVKAKRAALKKQNISISVNVFIAKAVALALKEFPNINAECIGDAVVHKTKVNLGIAVSLDNGLVVPVIRNADRKSGVRTRIAAFCFRIYFVQTSTTVMPSETSKFWRDSILPAWLPLPSS